jgi:acyl-CoA thioester hydrolase
MTLLKSTHQRVFNIDWGDMDALGHVNNGRYFDYFQQARIDWLHALNLDMTNNEGPVVIHMACTFLKPIIYPATLTLDSHAHTPGRSSLMMTHHIYQENSLMAEGTSKIVWVDYKTNRSIPLPKIILDSL